MPRRALRQRLGASVADLDAVRLQARFRGLGLTALADLELRAPVRVGGEVTRVVFAPRSGVPTLEVTLSDGTGSVTAVFLGRRRIPGLDHGRAAVLEGVATDDRGRATIINPTYTLVG